MRSFTNPEESVSYNRRFPYEATSLSKALCSVILIDNRQSELRIVWYCQWTFPAYLHVLRRCCQRLDKGIKFSLLERNCYQCQ